MELTHSFKNDLYFWRNAKSSNIVLLQNNNFDCICTVGKITSVAVCRRKKDQTEVSHLSCDASLKPSPITETCKVILCYWCSVCAYSLFRFLETYFLRDRSLNMWGGWSDFEKISKNSRRPGGFGPYIFWHFLQKKSFWQNFPKFWIPYITGNDRSLNAIYQLIGSILYNVRF